MPNTPRLFKQSYLIAALFWALLTPPNAFGIEKSKSQKVIDFESEVVEGLNKRPLDSLSQISDRNKRRHRPHLYLKRAGFRTEIAESLRALPLTHENLQ